jgi:hypothetical protein
MKGSILSLSAGSSSVKFTLFNAADDLTATVRGKIEDLDSTSHMTARDPPGTVLAEMRLPPGFDLALHTLLEFADNHPGHDGLTAVGHRIVHDGADHTVLELIMPTLLTAMRALDPLHMPDNLAPKQAVAAARPALMQVACFNTAFHRTMPSVAKRFALPRRFRPWVCAVMVSTACPTSISPAVWRTSRRPWPTSGIVAHLQSARAVGRQEHRYDRTRASRDRYERGDGRDARRAEAPGPVRLTPSTNHVSRFRIVAASRSTNG